MPTRTITYEEVVRYSAQITVTEEQATQLDQREMGSDEWFDLVEDSEFVAVTERELIEVVNP